MKRTIALLMALIFCIALLAGCGGGGTQLKGKYVLTAVFEEGLEVSKQMFEMMGLKPEDTYIEFKSGGKCKLVLFGEQFDAQYTVSENKVSIGIGDEDDQLVGEIKGKKIDFEEMVFEKK